MNLEDAVREALRDEAEQYRPTAAATNQLSIRMRRREIASRIVTSVSACFVLAGAIYGISTLVRDERPTPIVIGPHSSPTPTTSLSPTTEPRSPAASGMSVTVGAEPLDLAFDGEYIWVASIENILKLDPQSRRIARRIDIGEQESTLPGGGQALAVGEGSVWVVNPSGTDGNPRYPDGTSGGVARIDRSTGRLEDTHVFISETPVDVSFDGKALWVLTDRRLLRLNPMSLVREGAIGLEASGHTVVSNDDVVWVGGERETGEGALIVQVDSTQERVVRQTELSGHLRDMKVLGNDLWVITEGPDPGAGTLYRIHADGIQGKFSLPSQPGAITPLRGAVWVAFSNATISELDEQDGSIRRTLSLREAPSEMISINRTLWLLEPFRGALFALSTSQ